MDWTIFHAANGVLAGRDWLEDPVTGILAVAVPVYAAATTNPPPKGLLNARTATAIANAAAA